MELQAKGIFLSQQRLGESQHIVRVFSAEYGLISGVAHLPKNTKKNVQLAPGAYVQIVWRARLEEHLGKMRIEREDAQIVHALSLSSGAMQALMLICGLLQKSTNERQPEHGLYAGTLACLEALGGDHWLYAYLEWERLFLEKSGFGFALDSCAADGCDALNLPYISPKSGRAICKAHAQPYLAQVMELPLIWQSPRQDSVENFHEELFKGFALTELFLSRELLQNAASLLDFRRIMLEKQRKSS